MGGSHSKKEVATKVYELKQKIVSAKQGFKTTTKYYNTLKRALARIRPSPRCWDGESAPDTKKLKDMIEKEQKFYFLVGLSPKYNHIYGQIQTRNLFQLEERYFLMFKEKKVERLWCWEKSEYPTLENSA